MKKENIPGLAIGVVKNGKPLMSKGFGYSNLEHNIPANEHSIFGIASVTKIFTAISIMMLVEKNKLSLKDTMGKYFNDIPAIWRPITVKQLLNHTSGISSFSDNEKIPCAVGKDVREYKRGDAWKEVACLPLDFKPGDDWAYGDTGYYLLGLLIEKISGKNYETFIEEKIFRPMQMKKSRLIGYKELIPNRVDGYSYKDNRFVLAPRFEIDEFSNGGIASSIADMMQLPRAFTTEVLLKKDTWKQMWLPTVLNNGKIFQSYGLGFGLSPYEGRKRIGHNGGGGLGFSTSLTHFPEESLTVVLLTNVNLPEGRSGALANKIASFYFD